MTRSTPGKRDYQHGSDRQGGNALHHLTRFLLLVRVLWRLAQLE
jgi:hypothetical protein